MQLKFRQIAPLIGDEQRNRIWKYAAHHSWVDQSTLILTICWQETGIHKHGNSIFMKIP